jgi:hypothetical protein
LGGIPRIYQVVPAGKIEVINTTPGTTVFAAAAAKILKPVSINR